MKNAYSLALLLFLAACAASTARAGWNGRWTGPEGTLLDIAGGAPEYTITIHSLDGVAEYKGRGDGDGIVFTRGGQIERITAGGGGDTGMKWLMEKKDCLVIRPGEGFCRD